MRSTLLTLGVLAAAIAAMPDRAAADPPIAVTCAPQYAAPAVHIECGAIHARITIGGVVAVGEVIELASVEAVAPAAPSGVGWSQLSDVPFTRTPQLTRSTMHEIIVGAGESADRTTR